MELLKEPFAGGQSLSPARRQKSERRGPSEVISCDHTHRERHSHTLKLPAPKEKGRKTPDKQHREEKRGREANRRAGPKWEGNLGGKEVLYSETLSFPQLASPGR
ncbi:hypothetical protein KIL84_008440 [Mauremys mutica]|uniref:Uncharacterized protein n=1 Tax=Mauremys mutica TaxID=74926 RepID=A0A9D3X9A9_9SAUR|nr:hypothetical protein KIL84_008440 [Mauremys mutica]